ncbi:hypothetical protein Pcinc_010002 [Petrolisthes cinctipes]|uniref:Apple domain-containing protein n=1 Tax=Petrolisthes cinctipes TaxID=88211 RepID=A0AAE1G3M2_PETCI|nr:hypothetical protein Pcinc_010002 [Petrolisthes cinctipes]
MITMLATLKKSMIEGLASPPSSLWLLLLLVELLLVLECHAVKESLVVYQDTTLTTTEHEVDSLSLCKCRMMCLTYPPCTAVAFTNQSSGSSRCLLSTDPDPSSLLQSQPRVVTLVYATSVISTTTTAAAPTRIRSVVRSGAKTSTGTPSSVKAICEVEGYTSVTAANFEHFIQKTTSYTFYGFSDMFLGFMRNNDKVDFADGSSLPWSDVQQILNDEFSTVNINDGTDCFLREGSRTVTQGLCSFPNDDYRVVCVEV